jgi:hypothetical protein
VRRAELDGLQLDSFQIPIASVGLVKGTAVAGVAAGVDPWVIEGRASTPRQDQQGEIVLVKGLDLSYLDRGLGTFNWNHFGDKDPSAVIGLIQQYRRTDDGELYVKGKLLKALPKAQHCWNLLKALDEEGESRRMGMSVEGKVLHKHNKIIYKAWVKAVALTMDPVNPDTYVRFAKSFSDAEFASDSELTEFDPSVLERALSIASTSGAALGGVNGASILSKEDLEKEPKDLDYAGGHTSSEDAEHSENRSRKRASEKMSKGYSYDEAVMLVKQLCPATPDDVVHGIVRFAFQNAAGA